MNTSIQQRHHFGVKCSVDGCGDFVRVKKHGLCATHYHRWRDTGRTAVLTVTKACVECGSMMLLEGAAAARQRFCSDKCREVQRLCRRAGNDGYRVRAASYKYGWKLMNHYGITEDDYRRLHEAQLGLCAICLRSEDEIGERLCVDHDHANGRVRGLLCRKCNKAVGGFEESLERLERAADYLRSPTIDVVDEVAILK